MTVSTAYAPLTYAGNGATTAFAVTWPFLTGSLVVTLVASTGVETVKTITSEYTVSGGTDANGLPATGTVTMLVAPPSGSTLRIARSTPKTQTATWGENDAFPQKVIESGFDKLTMLLQEGGSGGGTAYDEITGDTIQLDSSGAVDYWDAESHILRNLADGQASTDAVTLAQLNAAQIAAANIAGGTSGHALIGNGASAATWQGFTQSGTGAVTQTWSTAVRAFGLTPEQFGAVGDGNVTTDTTNFQKGIDALPSGGGTLRAIAKYKVGGISISDNCAVSGDLLNPEQQDVGESYYSLNSQIRQTTTSTITLGRASGVANMAILRDGLTQPPANDTDCTAILTQLQGTGITANEVGCSVSNALILGHEYGIDVTHAADGGRTELTGLRIDAENGVRITDALDICYLEDIHCWPFLTVHVSGVSTANLCRPGSAFYFLGTNDWLNAYKCFSYGYVYGFTVDGGSNVELVRCQADTASAVHSVAGFRFIDDARYCKMVDCTSIGPATGVLVSSTSSAVRVLEMHGGTFSSSTKCVDITDGSVTIIGGTFETASVAAIDIGASAGNVLIIAPTIKDVSGVGIRFDASWAGTAVIVAPEFVNVTTKMTIPAAVRDQVQLVGFQPGDALAYETGTPTPTATSGTFTSVAAATRFIRRNKTIYLHATVTITTNGTAAGELRVPLPVTAGGGAYVGAGRETASTGQQLQAHIGAGGTYMSILEPDNTYPGADGYVLSVSIIYEAA